MSSYNVAHLHEQGQDMVIIPLTRQPNPATISALQIAANSAGMRGTVVPVWLSGYRMMFIAPQPWHPFFRSLDWNTVQANINKKLTIY